MQKIKHTSVCLNYHELCLKFNVHQLYFLIYGDKPIKENIRCYDCDVMAYFRRVKLARERNVKIERLISAVKS